PDLSGRVRLPGPLADARVALADSTCLLHCADCEPFGMVLVEALAAGRAVVAPASCGPAEIVTPECGRLFVPGDPQAAADALVAYAGAPGGAVDPGGAACDRRHQRARGGAPRDRGCRAGGSGDGSPPAGARTGSLPSRPPARGARPSGRAPMGAGATPAGDAP